MDIVHRQLIVNDDTAVTRWLNIILYQLPPSSLTWQYDHMHQNNDGGNNWTFVIDMLDKV